ncbi:flap endonuclease 1 [Sarcoptes scabiei]|nr:flap endonuclease 1 [Sarcoptes scabiei]
MNSFRSFRLFSMIIVSILIATKIDLSSSQSCRSPIYNSNSIKNFTNVMCSYCLYTIHFSKASFVWKRLSNWRFNIHQATIRIQYDQNTIVFYKIDFDRLKRKNLHNNPILQEFSNEFYMNQFLECCQNAHDCCDGMLKRSANNPNTNSNDPKCPMMWDGWSCWNETDIDSESENICPGISLLTLGDVPKCLRSSSVKQCYTDGKWSNHTDYMPCTRVASSTRRSIARTTIVSHSISLILTTVGSILFVVLKLQHKYRIQIHLNFFISIILSSSMSILYDIFVTIAHIEHRSNWILQK